MKGLAVLALAAVTLTAPAFASLMAPVPTDVTVLIPKATKMVRAKRGFTRAVLLEADGTPLRGRVTSAAGIEKWRFVYNNQLTKGFKFRSAALYYKNGAFTRFVPHKEAFVEDKNIGAVPKMTLAGAVRKLRAAGHRKPFGAVTLRYPIMGWSEPLYIFGFGNGEFWTVGTRTGKVKPI